MIALAYSMDLMVIMMTTITILLISIEHVVCARSDPKCPLFLTFPLIVPITVHFA